MTFETIPSTWNTVLTYIGPLGAALFGWLLHEFSDLFKLRREDKRAVGRVLAELLEVRARLLAIPTVIEGAKKKIPLAPHDEATLRLAVGNFLPSVEQLQQRYNQAIDGMAGRLPMLAFRLRSRDIATPVLRQLHAFTSNDPQAAAVMVKMEDELVRRGLPQFDELALELAQLHGWRTWWRARRKLKEPVSTKEFEDLFDYMIAEAKKAEAAKAQGQQGKAP